MREPRPAASVFHGRGSSVFSERLGVFMIEALPIGPEGIYRAAEKMIGEHGSEALAEAKKEAQTARAEGIESLAKTWDLVCAVVRDLEGLPAAQCRGI